MESQFNMEPNHHEMENTISPDAKMVNTKAKRAHVNMMTDTIIANLPAEGLRSVVRSILTLHPSFTGPFEEEAKNYLMSSVPQPISFFVKGQNGCLTLNEGCKALQGRIRSMLGCGLVYESIPFFDAIVNQVADASSVDGLWAQAPVVDVLASIDGDFVQATTAIQKMLVNSSGVRPLKPDEKAAIRSLTVGLMVCKDKFTAAAQEFPFERGLLVLENLEPSTAAVKQSSSGLSGTIKFPVNVPSGVETFLLGDRRVPRLFCGLWQLSSPAWGTAPQSKIIQQFANYVNHGFTAFDMADHYGDAEVVFGRFRESCSDPKSIFGATKYCVFHSIKVTPEVVMANVTGRCQRLGSEKVDLLQFHWQDYSDPQYLEALQILEKDDRVSALGLCNFDTSHMETILEKGITVAANQVQFSLIDSRPVFRMGGVCEKHNVKLLTYGTLCGGWLADKWLGKEEPELFDGNVTPSQRKYYEMILSWGGWKLFQRLLLTLSAIATKHGVSIANVATRWVLDHPFVGAVLVGSRMGVSERADENFATYGWHLDETDKQAVEHVLKESRREEMFVAMGDCGGEYR